MSLWFAAMLCGLWFACTCCVCVCVLVCFMRWRELHRVVLYGVFILVVLCLCVVVDYYAFACFVSGLLCDVVWSVCCGFCVFM